MWVNTELTFLPSVVPSPTIVVHHCCCRLVHRGPFFSITLDSGALSPSASGGGGGGGISRTAMAALRARTNGAPKPRRRWCVLDATRFTLFKSRSKTKVKDHVPLDPRTVALVTPPFTPFGRGGASGGKGGGDATTNERDAVALVCSNLPAEMGTLVIRAEQVEAQEVWVRAFAARLTSRHHHARMAELYGRGDD